jgi:hypothetical protein
MSTADLREEWRRVMGEEPRSYHRRWLWRRLAWAIQSKEYGGLSALAQKRLEELSVHAEAWMPLGKRAFRGLASEAAPGPRRPSPGSVLTRRYRGRTIVITVRDDGFEYEGKIYGSLTAVAKAVTGGSHQSGNAFFGLKRTGKAR